MSHGVGWENEWTHIQTLSLLVTRGGKCPDKRCFLGGRVSCSDTTRAPMCGAESHGSSLEKLDPQWQLGPEDGWQVRGSAGAHARCSRCYAWSLTHSRARVIVTHSKWGWAELVITTDRDMIEICMRHFGNVILYYVYLKVSFIRHV